MVFATPQPHPNHRHSHIQNSVRTFSVGRPAIQQQQQLPTLALPSSLSHVSLPHYPHHHRQLQQQQQQQPSRSYISIPLSLDDQRPTYVIGDATDDDATPVDTPERTSFLKKEQYKLPLNGSCESLQCDSGCEEPLGHLDDVIGEVHEQGECEGEEEEFDSPV